MIARKWTLYLLTLCTSMLVLTGCSQPGVAKDTAARERAVPFTIVASGDSTADIGSATTYAWKPDMHAVHGAPRLGDVPVAELLEDAISGAMNKKGYRHTGPRDAGDLQIGYLVAIGDAEAVRKMEDRYGVQPGLAVASPDPGRYEKGTLIITVVDRRSGLVAWRSALQGFASQNISEETRRERINDIVTRMLAGIPARAVQAP